jgi:predicted nucleotide-binding protein
MLLPIRSDHPDHDAVERYAMNHLSADQQQSFEEHLLVCQSCQLRLAEYDAYITTTRAALRTFKRKSVAFEHPFTKNVFITHAGPEMRAVEDLGELVDALGLNPVVCIQMPNLGLSVNDKVHKYMRICGSAIVLATAEEPDLAQTTRTRPNVEHEIGMLQALPNIGNRIVYMKEPNVQSPSNYSEKVWIPFDRDRISESFVPLIQELRAFGL